MLKYLTDTYSDGTAAWACVMYVVQVLQYLLTFARRIVWFFFLQIDVIFIFSSVQLSAPVFFSRWSRNSLKLYLVTLDLLLTLSSSSLPPPPPSRASTCRWDDPRFQWRQWMKNIILQCLNISTKQTKVGLQIDFL